MNALLGSIAGLIVGVVVASTVTGTAAPGARRGEEVEDLRPGAEPEGQAGPVPPRPTGDPARAEDIKAIAAVNLAFVQAFNKGDSRALADLFSDDAEVADESGSTVRGRSAIADHFASGFTADPKATIELTSSSIRFLGADVARESGRSIINPGDGGSPEITRYTVLFVHKDGRWLQDSVEESSDPYLTPHERLMELAWLLGDWVDEGEAGVVRTSCRWSEDKNFLIRDFTVHLAGQPFPGGSQRIGWDPGRDGFKSWVFDSDGGHSEGIWSRSARNEWTIRAEGVLADGRSVESTQIVHFESKGRARWRTIDRVIAGEPEPDAPEIVLVRTPPKPSVPAVSPK